MQQKHVFFTAGNDQVYAPVSMSFFFPIKSKIERKYPTRWPKYSEFVAISRVSALICIPYLKLEVVEKENISETCLFLTHTIFFLQYCICFQKFCLTADLQLLCCQLSLLLSHQTIYCQFFLTWTFTVNGVLFRKD